MLGAIIGDICGSSYEFDPIKTKDFDMFPRDASVTDDSVMTAAVAEVLLSLSGDESDDEIKDMLVSSMQSWGRRYPNAGYGGRFLRWLFKRNPEPYNSYGNGSAMRVSPAGWLYDTLDETRRMARLTSVVTHDHPEGIKGAEAVASAIYLARCGEDKSRIKEYLEQEFNYDLSRSADDIRPTYSFDVTCQGSVPESIICYLESDGLEDTVRTAISLGGDADTMAAIAGSIAEAEYGVEANLADMAYAYIPDDMLEVVTAFYRRIKGE